MLLGGLGRRDQRAMRSACVMSAKAPGLRELRVVLDRQGILPETFPRISSETLTQLLILCQCETEERVHGKRDSWFDEGVQARLRH